MFGGKRTQPGNQPIHVGAVGDDNPAQIGTKTLELVKASQFGYAEVRAPVLHGQIR